MSLLEFMNSGFGLLIIGTAFTIIGGFIGKIWSSISSLDDKVLILQYQTENHEATKDSIAGIGKRVGDTEADIKLSAQRMEQYELMISETREDRKTHNQFVAEIYNLLNKMQIDIGVLKNEVKK